MKQPKLVRPIDLDLAAEALGLLSMQPIQALRDPVRAMRIAATVRLEDGNRFLRLVLRRDSAVDLCAYEGEDEARLFLAGVLACFLAEVRTLRRSGYASDPAAVASMVA